MRFNGAMLGAAFGLAGPGSTAFGPPPGAIGLHSSRPTTSGGGVVSSSHGIVCGRVRYVAGLVVGVSFSILRGVYIV